MSYNGNGHCPNCKNFADPDDLDLRGCSGIPYPTGEFPYESKAHCYESKDGVEVEEVKPKKIETKRFYWYSSKEGNWEYIHEFEPEEGMEFFEDHDARTNFLYTGYEIHCDAEVHEDGRVFATHFMGVKLPEKVQI